MYNIKKDKRILLINPPSYRLKRMKHGGFPIGLGYIAAVLEKEGYFVRIYDADVEKDRDRLKTVLTTSGLVRERVNSFNEFLENLKNDEYYVWKEIREVIEEFKPDVVGVTVMTETYPASLKIARICKEIDRDAVVIFGGSHITLAYNQVINERDVDFLVRGEGEKTIVELLDAIFSNGDFTEINGISYRENGQERHNPEREFIENLDELPFPAWHLLLFQEYTDPPKGILGSRGCPYNCTFCGSSKIWKRKLRVRSIDNILGEIEKLIKDYGKPGEKFDIKFWDDTFTSIRKNVINFCNALIERGLNKRIRWYCLTRVNLIDEEILKLLKKSGCNAIALGIESGSDRILKAIRKRITTEQVRNAVKLIKKHGFRLNTYWMLGFPEETEEDIKASISFLKELKPDSAFVSVLVPFVGTDEYEKVLQAGLMDESYDWKVPVNPYKGYTNLPQERFDELFDEYLRAAEGLEKGITKKIKLCLDYLDTLRKHPDRIRHIKRVLAN